MNKLIALILSLMVLLCCAAAVAEEAAEPVVIDTLIVTEADDEIMEAMHVEAGTAINITVEAPADYVILPEVGDPDTVHLTFVGPEGSVTYYLNIAYSDMFGNYTLNELSEEEFAQAKEWLTEDFNDAMVEVTETGMGTKVIAVEEQNAEDDYGFLLTIYRGYFIQVDMFKAGAELTREEFKTGLDILTSLAFVTE